MFQINQTTGQIDFSADDLPAIVGSEKQITWATDLRLKKGRYLANQFSLMFSNARNDGKVTSEQRPEALSVWASRHAAELSNTDARYWIDHR
jgi:hypothetical protein